ncbi:MAG: hypothetical protein V3W01_02540 [Dehalococcoidales bacterium]
MKVGILELLVATPANRSSPGMIGYYLVTKQFASIMPQAIAVWSRQKGHRTFYATYFGQAAPKRLLPDDLDVVFISASTQASALAYALAKLYRIEHTLTILGGPHAKSFPDDSLRFFDLVVQECDRTLVADILNGIFPHGTVLSSGRLFTDIPSVEERMPEIRTSAFTRGVPYLSTCIPILTSVGCPYNCDFCTDWNNPYVLLPLDRLEGDLRYLHSAFPGVRIAFHDPNFGVKFDQVLNVIEGVSEMAPGKSRNPYIMESSLSLLREPRLQRLQNTRCSFLAPGVESWTSYSNKSGAAGSCGSQKVDQVVEHFELIHRYVPGLQANFIFGLDVDEGDEPIELTKEFITHTPFVWPVINIATPFGGTPLYEQHLTEGRVLTSMPLSLYYSPYLVTVLKHYSPVTYYEKLIDLCVHISSKALLWQRVRSSSNLAMRLLMTIRSTGMAYRIQDFRRILNMLTTDQQFRAFHETDSQVLPEFYHCEYERLLGPYAPLLSREDRTPVFTQAQSRHVEAVDSGD